MDRASAPTAYSNGGEAIFGPWQNFRKVPICTRILDFFYTLWVLRAPFAGAVAGTLLLMVPQAEDLFVQLATGFWLRIVIFFLLLFLVWAGTTHYGARLLISSDDRYSRWLAPRPPRYRGRLQKWSPRVLALAPFAAVFTSIVWSAAILPRVHDKGVTENAKLWLTVLAVITILAAILFFAYMVWRSSIAAVPFINWAAAYARRLMCAVR
jgi:hypothetical protein